MKWNIGDRPWLATVGRKSVERSCPICAGKKQVTLILGTEESVILPCSYCAPGYEEPRGWVTEYEFISNAEQLTICEMRVKSNSDGEKREYIFSGNRYVDDENKLHHTREEALVECEVLCKQIEHDENTRSEYIKADKKKTFSWNAGYHLREAKRDEESAARHRRQAALCKAKSKERDAS
jgi:hypothetical protein